MAAARKAGPWNGVDSLILGMIVFLMVAGLIAVFASSPAAAPQNQGAFYYLYRQLAFAGAGVGLLAVFSLLSPAGVRRVAALVLLGSLVLMIVVLIAGLDVKGATRWIRLGGMQLQPSEFFKPAFIVIAAWLITEEDNGAPVWGRFAAIAIFCFAAVLLWLQPDFGQIALLAIILAGMLWISGLNLRLTAALTGAGALLGAAALTFLPHVRRRLMEFIAPAEPGAGWTQSEKALEAINRGGLFGAGVGEGRIKHDLPEAHNDYIFSVATEEYGLLFSLSVIAAYLILLAAIWSRAMHLRDPFVRLASAGLALLFGMQAVINIAVNLNLVPSTGMTLPFISYGGSSMLSLSFAAGLILALTRQRPGAYETVASRRYA